MRGLVVLPYILACLYAQPKTPATAVIDNQLEGTGRFVLEDIERYMEQKSKSNFLHAKDPDLIITIRYAQLPDKEILGLAHPKPGRCEIDITEELNPENPRYKWYYDLPMVIMHEIGHCFGLPHVPNPKAVMYYMQNEYERSPESQKEFFDSLDEIRGVR